MKLLFPMMLCFFLSVGVIGQLPAVRISGYVRAAASEAALQGANIRLQKSNTAAVSNEKGFFIISLSERTDTLLLSYTGYQTTRLAVSVANQFPLQLVLQEDITGLADVSIVSTGYQAIPKERATGSFEVIGKALINRSTGSNILNRLDGITNSLYFDKRSQSPDQNGISASQLTVRGLSTLTASSKAPLVVLDNFPYEGDINNINPNDVESISLLKDAAAASIWGASAGNGVLVITTKKGGSNRPPQVSANINYSISQQPDLFYYPAMSTGDFIAVEKFLFDKGYYSAALSQRNGQALSPVVELLQQEKTGQVSAPAAAQQLADWAMQDVRNDYKKYIYQPASTMQYSLSISGGQGILRYYLSAGYDNSEASLQGNQNDRFTVRSQNNIALSKKLDIDLTLQMTGSTASTPNVFGYGQYSYGAGRRLYPYARLADDNGNPLPLSKDYRQPYIDTVGKGKLLDWQYRPLDEIKAASNNSRQQDYLLQLAGHYRLNKFMTVSMRYQLEQANTRGGNLHGLEQYYTRNLVNLFTQVSGNATSYLLPRGAILETREQQLVSQAGRLQLNADKNWSNQQLAILAGAEIRENRIDQQAHTVYGFHPENLTAATVDLKNAYPYYDGLGAGAIPAGLYFEQYNNRFLSGYLNAAYTLRGKYILSASARRDATNLFGASTNNKWKPLWSTGLSWEISKEAFYHSSFLPYLRLRVTYGYNGNTNNGYSAKPILNITSGSSSIIDQPIASITQFGNRNLRWESVGIFNVGIDLRSRDNRLTAALEYYDKRPRDVISGVTADPTTGILGYNANSVHLLTRGIDINLASINTTGAVRWETNLLFSYLHSRITKFLFDRSTDLGSGFTGSGLLITAVEGKNPYGLYSYAWAGLDASGNPQGYIDGKPGTDYNTITRNTYISDMVYNGPATPTIFGSLRNSLRAGNLQLSFNILYRFGYYFRKTALRYDMLYGQGMAHADYAKRWQQPGDEKHTSIPAQVYPLVSGRDAFYQAASVNVLPADNIRLQDISLSYDWKLTPKKNEHGMQLQLYVYASNLWLIWTANKEGLDPDYSAGNPLFPPMRSIAGGIRINL